MANSASGTYNKLSGRLNTVVTDNSGSRPLISGGPALDASVEDAAPAPNITVLGRRAEGAFAKSFVTVLGPCVGDD
jgi:hypothetical protein